MRSEDIAWRKRIDRCVDDPNSLDGMRAAFRTTIDRQKENVSKISDLEGRRKRAKDVRRLSLADEKLLAQAMERMRANRLRVLGPFSRAEAQEVVLRELGDEVLVVKSKSNVTKEIELTKFLEKHGKKVIETDVGDRIIQIAGRKPAHPTGPAVDLTRYQVAEILGKHFGEDIDPDPEKLTHIIRDEVRSYIDKAKIGITGANYLTAEEGAVLIIHNEGNAAECARRPLKHIIVTATDKVVPDLDEAINLAKLQTYYATGKLVSQYINVISGPSMTADIEKKTFYGMHGPEEVVVVLVDNGRSSVPDEEVLDCINCGSCLLRCPVYDIVGKEFGGPAHLGGRGVCFTASTDSMESSVQGGLALCTNCGLCTEMCPVGIDTPKLMRETRASAVMDRGPLEPEHDMLAKSVRNYHNPWMQPRAMRAKWARGLELKDKGPVLYFAGCSHSLLSPEVSRSTIALLRRGGLDVSYLAGEEPCCGSVLLKTGQREAYERVRDENVRKILASGASKVITACPGCFNALSHYRDEVDGFKMEVEHVTQTLALLLEEGRLRFGGAPIKVTYHDPCDLGRHGKVFEAPRNILRSMPGVELVEMGENRARSVCCGSGGGVKTAFPRLATSIGAKRIAQAQETRAQLLLTACPWCEANLRDCQRDDENKLEVDDLVSFLESRLIPS